MFKEDKIMKKTKFLFLYVVTALILTICLDVNFVYAESNEKEPLTQSITSPETPYAIQHSGDTGDPTGYWTKERMMNAIPVENIEESDEKQKNILIEEEYKTSITTEPYNVSYPVAPKPKNSDGIQLLNLILPSTAGKVFYTYKNEDYACSGATINSNYKNLVMTAGHCLHGGKGKDWHSNVAFAPAYEYGNTPYGIWNYKESRTLNAWINESDFSRDQGFFSVHPKSGKNLVDVVGGNGLSIGTNTIRPSVRVFGWPGEYPYDGETAKACEGPSSSGEFSGDAKVVCGMNKGSSGGPWLSEIVNDDVGFVIAVTSRVSTRPSATTGKLYVYATPNSKDVEAMYKLMK